MLKKFLYIFVFLTSCTPEPYKGTEGFAIDPEFEPSVKEVNVTNGDIDTLSCIYENNFVLLKADSSVFATAKWYKVVGNDRIYSSNNLSQNVSVEGDYELEYTNYKNGQPIDTVIKIKVEYCLAYVEYPNVFEPNGDGAFDFWAPVGEGVAKIRYSVIGADGAVLFEGNSMEEKWDGFSRGKKMSPGTYTYTASGTLRSGYLFDSKGTFELVR